MRESDIQSRAVLVLTHGWDRAGFFAWSAGEQLVTALVVDAASDDETDLGQSAEQVLGVLGWTAEEALERIAADRDLTVAETREWVNVQAIVVAVEMDRSPSRYDRQRALITPAEQQRLAGAVVALAGMGVGASIAQQLALVGVGTLRISDGDDIALTNLNRHPIAVNSDVGQPKTTVMAQYLGALNPEVTVDVRDATDGLNVESFCKADVVVDEVDCIATKWMLRWTARRLGVPVVMATDLGDERVLLDVERFDQEARFPFHGLVDDAQTEGEVLTKLFRRHCSKDLWAALRIGASFPQLGSTMAVASGVTARAVRDIIIGRDVPSGRFVYDLGLPVLEAEGVR